VKNNKSSTIQQYNNDPTIHYPKDLDPKFLKQLNKVYTSCIHLSQYLPQLITLENSHLIHQAGLYIAEKRLLQQIKGNFSNIFTIF
jgi:hypothetical protein